LDKATGQKSTNLLSGHGMQQKSVLLNRDSLV